MNTKQLAMIASNSLPFIHGLIEITEPLGYWRLLIVVPIVMRLGVPKLPTWFE